MLDLHQNRTFLQGLPETQGAAAVAIAHCYSQPVIVKPLFSSPEALEKKMANWEIVADSANDAVPRVVHGGLVAVSRMIQKYLDAKSAREADQTSDLQTVLGLMAWAGAVRLRVAGAHVLDRMDAMPASLKVPLFCLPTLIVCVLKNPSVAARCQSLPVQLAVMCSATSARDHLAVDRVQRHCYPHLEVECLVVYRAVTIDRSTSVACCRRSVL